MIRTSDFDYELPPGLIAQQPLAERDASRMLVLGRRTGVVEHRQFADMPSFLRSGDVLVVNDTRVIPARLFGHRPSGGAVELLLVERIDAQRWRALARPGKRLHEGSEILFDDKLRATVQTKLPEGGEIIVSFDSPDITAALDRIGHVPLPPYIRHGQDDASDRDRYQTVFAQCPGAIAAPTAGLHFTSKTFEALAQRGVMVHRLTLHVGLGTFKPVAIENLEEHTMHVERFEIPEDTARAVNTAKLDGRRVICVGTTTVRALESVADANGQVRAGAGETDIFIYPPYQFAVADALLTNFHLPRSTLLMLISAFAGRDAVLNAYAEAVREQYRFYSYGDCMLII